MQQYDAFILAGGRCPWLKEALGTEFRILATVNGRPMLEYIVQALQQSGRVRNIVVAAMPEAKKSLARILPPGVSICDAEGDMPTTAYAAAQALGAKSSARLLAVCDDIPLLNAEAVCSFFEQCEQHPSAEVCYAVIPKDVCLRQYPAAKRTFGALREGSFTGGNLMLITHKVISERQALGKQIYALRKSPFKLASWLGWSFIFKAVLHLLSVQAAEQRVSEILQAECRAIITGHACIGMDVDKPEDLALVEKYLSK